MFTYLDKYLQSQKKSRFLLGLSRRIEISPSDNLRIKKEVNKMKEITKAKLEEMLDEMSDDELNLFIENQIQLLEVAFQVMGYRNFSYKVENKMLKNNQCYAQQNLIRRFVMQKQKIIFKNKLDVGILDDNFYKIIFEQILSLHKKT